MKSKEIIAASQEIVSSFHDVGNKSFSNEAASILNKPHFLYVLKDPFTFQIRYVGITYDLKARKSDHLGKRLDVDNNKLLLWKDLLKIKNAVPIFEVIKKFNNHAIAHKFEIILIQALKDQLINVEHNNLIKKKRPKNLIYTKKEKEDESK